MASVVSTYYGNLRPLGYEQITDLSSAVGLTVPEGATLAVIKAVDQRVRLRDDGTSPTASVGFPLDLDEPFPYNGHLHAIEFIEEASGAELNVLYYAVR